ncbi:unnamed protein product [Ilex paraguariensis]|uniref:WAT1-related protein n=1 Tax=Ilex paraguariensis TaxID=185542 RepID=A0ABC8SW11_9AQUA
MNFACRSVAQMLSFSGLNYSSPTLSSALGNLIPIFTFLLAIIFRMEKLDLRGSGGLAVSLGAVVAVSGAFIVTLYKGPQILMVSSPSNFAHHHLYSQVSNWVLGGIFLSMTSILTAIWNILMAIFGGVFRNGIHTWCFQEKGPVFVAMFRPLGIAIAVFMGVAFLGDTLYLGRILGSIIIVVGFYAVLWGKANELSLNDDNVVEGLESCSQKTPFLENNSQGEI